MSSTKSTKPISITTLNWKTASEQIETGTLDAHRVRQAIDASKISYACVIIALFGLFCTGLSLRCPDLPLGFKIFFGCFFGIPTLALIVSGVESAFTIAQQRKKIENDDKTGNSYLAELLAEDLAGCEAILKGYESLGEGWENHRSKTEKNARTLRSYLSTELQIRTPSSMPSA